MIGVILYVLGILAILLAIDLKHRRRADDWQRVVPSPLAGERPAVQPQFQEKEPASTQHCSGDAWRNQRKAA